jgi:CheY-like chemotaxis protein
VHHPVDREHLPVILLVSDSPDDPEVRNGTHAACALTPAPRCDVVVAQDSTRALHLLHGQENQPPLQPAMILLDLRTRDMNGFDFLIHVRADPTTRDLPVKMLTTITSQTSPTIVLSGQEPLPDRNAPRPRTSQELLRGLYALGATWLSNTSSAVGTRAESFLSSHVPLTAVPPVEGAA